MSWGWKGAAIAYSILSSCLIVLFIFPRDFQCFLPCHWCILFVDISAYSFSYYLLDLFKFAQHYNTVIAYKSRKWGMTKATGIFWIVLQKPGSVFTGWERAGLRDVEPAVFYNVVLSVTWQLTAVQLSPRLANSPVIFSIWKILGVTSVSDCWLKPDGGFPINKCTGSIYTDCGTWRHNTHDTLFSGQSCHKSL